MTGEGESDFVRAVVDTNLLVSGLILKRGIPYQLLEALRRGAFVLVASEALEEEYAEVLRRPHFEQRYGLTPKEVDDFLALISIAFKATSPSTLPVAVRDPKDEKVLAAALGGKAEYLVTGDEDLLDLAHAPGIGELEIVTAREFLEVLSSSLDESSD